VVGPFSGRLTLVDLFGLENQKTGGCKTDSWLKPLTNKSLMNDRVVIHEMATRWPRKIFVEMLNGGRTILIVFRPRNGFIMV